MRREFEDILGWWLLGCVTAADVVMWADRRIESAGSSDEIPEYLIAVSLEGPKAFWNRAHDGDPRPSEFDFPTAFRLMVEGTDASDEAAVGRFVDWVSNAAMAEDLSLDEVRAGYQIEDLRAYDQPAAILLARQVVERYRASCTLIRTKMPWRRAAEQPHAADGRRDGIE